jgi:hypothetical protein
MQQLVIPALKVNCEARESTLGWARIHCFTMNLNSMDRRLRGEDELK